MMKTTTFVLSLVLFTACASSAPGPGAAPAAPWSQPRLPATDVPGVYLEQWRNAENRGRCALLAPRSTGERGANPRAATFSGGWAVAYDTAATRSAFGVAGTGAPASGATYSWPYRKEWADGSTAGYGPEGGSGPNELAYVTIPGQDCLYNVWSRLGRDHLERLLGDLRFVETR